MANFSILDDNEYGDLFLTQKSSENVVSLEENMDYKTVHNSDYSDISDTEQDCMEEGMRLLFTMFILGKCLNFIDSNVVLRGLNYDFSIFFAGSFM